MAMLSSPVVILDRVPGPIPTFLSAVARVPVVWWPSKIPFEKLVPPNFASDNPSKFVTADALVK
ncbi:hypothetical protein D3C87_1750090 [compost metagenome]